jgi:Uma2 family endonuclease
MAEPIRKMPAEEEPNTPQSADDPFRYGWRTRRVQLPSGDVIEQEIPLTAEDLLDPQLGDVVTQSGPHFDYFVRMINLLRFYYQDRDDVLVAGDMKMLWGIPGLAGPSPDIAVIPGVGDKHDPQRASFDVVREGTRPCLVIEVVSSLDAEVRRNDYEKKVLIYERAAIPEYLILDPPSAWEGNLRLSGHRLGPDGRYRRIEPDRDGRLLSETTGLLFGVDEDGRTPMVLDSRTGERLLTPEERAALEKERAEAAEAEVSRLLAELEKLRITTADGASDG